MCVLALSPFDATASLYLYVLNNLLKAVAAFISFSVSDEISCFSFSSEVFIVALPQKISLYLAPEVHLDYH